MGWVSPWEGPHRILLSFTSTSIPSFSGYCTLIPHKRTGGTDFKKSCENNINLILLSLYEILFNIYVADSFLPTIFGA